MIYIGPDEQAEADIELAVELSLEKIMARSCAEIDELGCAVSRLEDVLIAKQSLMEDRQAQQILQSLDPIQQSLQALSRFLGAVSGQPGQINLQIEDALKNVHLQTMRNRLGKLPLQDTP